MCTVSWWKPSASADDYQVFFNRDEVNTRAIEYPPHAYFRDGQMAVYPLDPDAGGTWLGTTQEGKTVALLNDYQSPQPSGKLQSRGRLVTALLFSSDETTLLQKSAQQYRPFHLCIFRKKQAPSYFHWNGQSLTMRTIADQQSFFLTSSSFQPDEVIAQRTSLWEQVQKSEDHLRSFHQGSALTSLDAFTPYMRREDAHTRSFSHIVVGANRTRFVYRKSQLDKACWQEPITYVLPH